MGKNKKPLIVIAGPTASGKTKLSLMIAKEINGEIISGDSMQIYRKLNIGTAKITTEEMEGIPHHLIDIIDPKEEYNVWIFQDNAQKLIENIYSRGKVPIIVGGTGLYIDALIYDYSFPTTNQENKIRDILWEEYYKYGNQFLIDKLKILDPEALNIIDLENTKRLIRVLEICTKDNVKFSELEKNSRTEKESPFNLFYFVINMNRQELYDRINKRVDLMFEEGWIDEVKELLKFEPSLTEHRSMQGLGYKQIIQFLNDELTYEECVEKIKQNTRKFAKRQLTWFRKNKDIIWLDKDEKSTNDIFIEAMNNINKNI